MPETLAGLWKQRLRWAMGGIQVIKKYSHSLRTWHMRRMWVIYLEYLVSVVWAYSMAFIILLWVAGLAVQMPSHLQLSIVPGWHGVLIGTTCLLQILISMVLERRYDYKIFRHFFLVDLVSDCILVVEYDDYDLGSAESTTTQTWDASALGKPRSWSA